MKIVPPLKMVPIWWGDLSPRERDVFLWTARGATLSDIAARLDISASTASTYKGRVYKKTGLRNTAQFTLAALRGGLMDLNDPNPSGRLMTEASAGLPGHAHSGAGMVTEASGLEGLGPITAELPLYGGTFYFFRDRILFDGDEEAQARRRAAEESK